MEFKEILGFITVAWGVLYTYSVTSPLLYIYNIMFLSWQTILLVQNLNYAV